MSAIESTPVKNQPGLSIGSRIFVHGFVMLKGLDHGHKYQVTAQDDFSVTFKRVLANGKLSTKAVRHYKSKVNAEHHSEDYNWIELLSQPATQTYEQALNVATNLIGIGFCQPKFYKASVWAKANHMMLQLCELKVGVEPHDYGWGMGKYTNKGQLSHLELAKLMIKPEEFTN